MTAMTALSRSAPGFEEVAYAVADIVNSSASRTSTAVRRAADPYGSSTPSAATASTPTGRRPRHRRDHETVMRLAERPDPPGLGW